jgi:methylenetetrahydrofolate dehydrogenase (NADP+) / methenyltetrahydrofolate cyclohydrolase
VLYNNQLIKKEFKEYLESKTTELHSRLSLSIIQIGQDLASTKYVSMKQKLGAEIGIDVNVHNFMTNVDISKIHQVLDNNNSPENGLIFQLPVPGNLKFLVQKTPPIRDVDLLGDQNQRLWEHNFLPPTVGAIDLVLKDILLNSKLISQKLDTALDLSNKVVVVIGQGILVGSPLLKYLRDRSATIISLNKYTRNAQRLCQMGDIVISAAGSPKLVDNTWLKQGSVVIDASTSEENGSLVGDVDKNNLREDVILCPSPGGIGAITVLYLFYNLLKLRIINLK